MQHRRAGFVTAVVVAALVGPAFLGGTPAVDDGPPSVDHLVRVDDTNSYVWPYTSRRQSVEGRTLAINVVIRADEAEVRRVLTNRSEAEWGDVGGDDAVGETPWYPARGAARYTYVAAGEPVTGHWVESSYQLGTGTYLGRRVHVRAYPVPSSDWTALQAHTEYWDWFRLRHTVTGAASGARFVESDLRDEPFVTRVAREYHGFEGGGSDGWITVVELASVALFVGSTLPLLKRRQDVVDATLPVALVALVVGVRAVGIAAEGFSPDTDPKLFAAVLYPVVVLGPPVVTAVFARDRPPGRMALLAAGGLGAGVILDFGVVGVSMIPVRLALHRVALTVALGLFALGVARADRYTTKLGVAAWLGTLVAPLVGIV